MKTVGCQIKRKKIAPFKFGLAAREIIRSLGLKGDEKILEIGSGLGLLGEQIRTYS